MRPLDAIVPAGAAGMLLLALLPAWASALEPPEESYDSGWSLHIDNDLLVLRGRDRDYTGGLALNLAGERVAHWPLSLDPVLGRIDRLLGAAPPPASHPTLHSLQTGIAGFTPTVLDRPGVVAGDRPYASLVFLANSRLAIDPDQRSATQSTLTLGLLGLPATGKLHRGFHEVTGSPPPAGWDHQVSAGGELTGRYSYARQHLWTAGAGPLHQELKPSWEVGAGYITEANLALSWRGGRINTPWWSFTPDRAEYFAQPTPGVAANDIEGPRERYGWAGIKLRARAYNALLQGQFRHSDLVYDADDVRPLLAEGWLGLTVQTSRHYRLSWVLRYQTAELRHGAGDRELVWGSLFISRFP